MAEALLRHLGGARFEAYSAGSAPAGFIHWLAIDPLREMGITVHGQHSKHWEEIDVDEFNIVITLCDSAAQECPVWTGHPVTVHWGLPDPVLQEGEDRDRLEAAQAVARRLQRRISELVKLPIEELSPDQLKARLEQIARDDE
jgi:arsenate reductase